MDRLEIKGSVLGVGDLLGNVFHAQLEDTPFPRPQALSVIAVSVEGVNRQGNSLEQKGLS